MKTIEMDIADTIIDRPVGFTVGRRHFYLYPMTLGKFYLTKRIIESLAIDKKGLVENPFAEALRLASLKREECIMLIAYHSLQTKKELLSNRNVLIRRNLIDKELDTKDIATLLVACLSSDKTEAIAKHLGIDKEVERMRRVVAVKDDTNTYQFGGVSMYGSIIDSACERYGWTYDYVVWEISYTNLQLMLKDSVKSVYLTDEEVKRCGIPKQPAVNGNDLETTMQYISSQRWD